MTTITVSGYEDLKGDGVLTASEKDAILDALDDADDLLRAFWADSWLWEDKDLETSHRHDTLVYGAIIASTEKAYLVTQLSEEYETDEIDASDPQTDWVPKSVVRVYKADADGINSTGPQAFLGDYGDE